MIKQKKGIGFGMAILVMLISIVIGVVFFSEIVDFVINFIRTGGDASACALSIYSGKGVADCPIDELRIFDDRVEIKYGSQEEKDPEIFMEKGAGGTTYDMISATFAKLLQSCLHKGAS